MAIEDEELDKIAEIIKKSILIKDENPAVYQLQKKEDDLDQSKLYLRMAFGERVANKPHKTILLVGETGTGKTTLINTMVNYMLGVQRKDKVWFEITDENSDRTSAESQTSKITVYGVYLQESPVDLTIIDTPGYGDTRGVGLDKQIAESLFSLSKSTEGIKEIDTVCLVIKASQNRLSDRQIYIFDAVQSLFGKDVAENIVLLFTHSNGAPPKNALTAVKEAGVKCAVNEQKNQPVFFLFDNCQSDAADEDYEKIQEQSWNLAFKGIERLFKFVDTIKPKSLNMTQEVLRKRKQLEAKITNLQSKVSAMEENQNYLKQTQAALEQNKGKKNFDYEVDVPYKERVGIDISVASEAMCCTVCEENCHYPDCWWVSSLSWCSVMKDNFCTVCTNKCHYSKHVKEAKIYVTKTRKEKRTNKDLKKEYYDKIGNNESVVKNLEEDLRKLEIDKIKMVLEAFHCVEILNMIALNTHSLLILQNTDSLIKNLKEINEPDKAETLKDIKKSAGVGK